MSGLVDRWAAALAVLAAILGVGVVAVVSFQRGALERLNEGFVGVIDTEAQVEYSRLSSTYYLAMQTAPVLVFTTGIAVVALIIVLSRRWSRREELHVRAEAEA